MTDDMPANRNDDPTLLDQAAYVLGSRYRKAIVNELESSPTTPSQIADRNELSLSHVSRALSELREKDLVRSHSSDSRTKLYVLTTRGNRVADLVADLDEGGRR